MARAHNINMIMIIRTQLRDMISRNKTNAFHIVAAPNPGLDIVDVFRSCGPRAIRNSVVLAFPPTAQKSIVGKNEGIVCLFFSVRSVVLNQHDSLSGLTCNLVSESIQTHDIPVFV